MDPATLVEQVKRERDLFKQLLDLGTQDEVEPFLEKALELIVTMAGARRGYIELSGSGSAEGQTAGSRSEARAEAPAFWMAHGCSDTEIEKIRASFSSGIIADTLATGRTNMMPSALGHPHFRERRSVRRNRIEAVLCTPIGASPALGVVYLQDRDQGGSFSEDDRARAETFARALVPFADRLLIRRRRRDETDPTRPYREKLSAEGVIGRSQALARLLKDVSLVARLNFNVLLTGPTGTGKTQIARVIHNSSGPRATRQFLTINCAAVPEGLFESEIFGHTRGAFTGAASARKGLIEETEGGTFFFDEISELSMNAQAKLLQFLQSKEYLPLGGSQLLRANVRIIAATNVDLKEKVAAREFREDLLSRLEGVTIRVPSLAERQEDIAELAVFFCRSICEENGLSHLRLSVGALCALEAAAWPRNIRQLSGTILSAILRANSEGVHQIEERHLFPEAIEQEGDGQGSAEASLTLQAATRRFQDQFIRRTLEEMKWNYSQASKRLDIGRSTLYQMCTVFKIERPKR